MNYNWNWAIFWELSPDASGTYLQTLIYGLGWTLATALTPWVLRSWPGRSRRHLAHDARTNGRSVWATPITELFRNIPLLVQMFLWFFVVPELLPTAMGNWVKQTAQRQLLDRGRGAGTVHLGTGCRAGRPAFNRFPGARWLRARRWA